jgi:hypothetical protein
MWTNASMMGRAVSGVIVGTMMLLASSASADVASDQSGAILIFPKITVDTDGDFGPPQDTVIQMTNTSNSVVSARCFYVNATGHCSDTDEYCRDATDCSTGASCVPQWSKRDFRLTLTKRQPIAWRASEGLSDLPCDGIGSPDGGCPFGLSNIGADGSVSSIPPVAEDPFYGELRCIQVDPETFEPTAGLNDGNDRAGDLKGEATTVTIDGRPDANKHNALGIQSTTVNDNDDVLQIGGANAEYNACPSVLTLTHLFDGAVVGYGAGANSSTVRSALTVVPCGVDYLTDSTDPIVLQFLIFNEFEQRFSASTSFDCWRDIVLSDVDTRTGPAGDEFSIFSASVQGTLGGQTRVRPVAGNGQSNGILGVLTEGWSSEDALSTTSANVHFSGATVVGDQMILSPDNN